MISKSRKIFGFLTKGTTYSDHFANGLAGVAPPDTRAHGFTMVEMLITITIVALLATFAVPGFGELIDNRRIRAVAENMNAELQFARSEALKRDRTVRLIFIRNADGSQWCAGMTHAASCDCTETDPTAAQYCALDIDNDGDPGDIGKTDPVRIVSSDTWPDVRLQTANYGGGNPTLEFTAPHGLATEGYIEYISNRGQSIRVATDEVGRVRICSPDADNKLQGYPACA